MESGSEKASRWLYVSCLLVYAVTTTVKSCIGTVTPSMVNEGFLTKSQSGLILGIFYLVYGIVQLWFGSYYNKHNPNSGIVLSLIGSVVCCILMYAANSFLAILLIWSLCAFVNASMWPALMRVVTSSLNPKYSNLANKYLSVAYPVGTMFCLAAGGVIIKYIGWRVVYLFTAAVCLLVLIVWYYSAFISKKSLEQQAHTEKSIHGDTQADFLKNTKPKPLIKYFGSGFFLLLGFSFLIGLLSNGVSSWVPTIAMETYNTTPDFSVFLNIFVIVINIVVLMILSAIIPVGKLKYSFILSLITVPILILINFTNLFNEYTYMVLMGLFIAITSYLTNVCAVHLPIAFVKYNDVSRISGISNTSISIGVLASSCIYGISADAFGWGFIMKMWMVFGILCVILLLIAMPLWNKFIKSKVID